MTPITNQDAAIAHLTLQSPQQSSLQSPQQSPPQSPIAPEAPEAPQQGQPQANVLTRIVATKAAHIAALKLRFPEEALKPRVSDRSLFAALKAPKAGYILEC
ncbi:MAG: hypothetical protein ACRDA8_06790, partial [Shewanella sp.]